MWTFENDVKVLVSDNDIPSKDMDVFYNKAMVHNRNISLAVMSYLKPFRIGLPLAGSGVRAFRAFLENKNSLANSRFILNDVRQDFISDMHATLRENDLEKNRENFEFYSTEANIFLLQRKPFDYIDVDPFGSPVPFLMTAIRSLRISGFLSVTATDTGALCGSYEGACMRRYWARPSKSWSSKEIGLRILIRRVLLEGLSQGVVLSPVISYVKDHYFRVFFRSVHSKQGANKGFRNLSNGSNIGPYYTGLLQDNSFLQSVLDSMDDSLKEHKFLQNLMNENYESVGYLDLHRFASDNKLNKVPSLDEVRKVLENKGVQSFRTHFTRVGLKCDAPMHDVENIIRQSF